MPLIMNIKSDVYFSSLVIILLHDDAQPHVARVTLQKLTDLGYEIFTYSLDLSPTDCFFFFLQGLKTFHSKGEEKKLHLKIFFPFSLKTISFSVQIQITLLIDYRNGQWLEVDWLKTLFTFLNSRISLFQNSPVFFE